VKKIISILGLMVLVVLTAVGCGTKTGKEASAPVSEIVDKIQGEKEWPILMDLDDTTLNEIYGIDLSLLEEYAVKIPMMNIKTNELAVIKVKDEAKVEEVKKNVEQRAEMVKQSFEHYLPDQYEIAKNYLLEVKGKYILFVIDEDADKAQEVFNSYFK